MNVLPQQRYAQEVHARLMAGKPKESKLTTVKAALAHLITEKSVSPPIVKPRRLVGLIIELDDDGNPSVHNRWKIIALEVAKKHGLTLNDLMSIRRDQASVNARYEAFWRCRHETTMSLPQIGRRFGNRDHTTVLHGIQKHEKMLRGKS